MFKIDILRQKTIQLKLRAKSLFIRKDGNLLPFYYHEKLPQYNNITENRDMKSSRIIRMHSDRVGCALSYH
jgi:hypothetical protein